MNPKPHLHIKTNNEDEAKEVYRQLAEYSIIAVDRIYASRAGNRYKITRVEFKRPGSTAKP